MLTCKSPRKVLLTAYHLAKRCLPDHSSKFSRKDFTLPQLFACLVVREHQNKSYRGDRKVLLTAYHLAKRCLPDHSSKFSRKDFTLPQLFACLVVREHQNKSYR